MASGNPGSPTNGQPPPPAPKKRGNYLWLWFFVVVFFLTAGGITILSVYKWVFRPKQLTAEELAAARKLWKEKGPADYDLEYVQTGNVNNRVRVRVRGGEVVFAEPDTRLLEQKKDYYGMDALFRYLERFLKLDAEPGKPRAIMQARFDPDDGHLTHFVRRVPESRESLGIFVEWFKAVAPEKSGR
jgi:hypothetical protein